MIFAEEKKKEENIWRRRIFFVDEEEKEENIWRRIFLRRRWKRRLIFEDGKYIFVGVEDR